MNLKFWTWFAGRGRTFNPRVIFELVGNGRIHVLADWPDVEQTADKAALGETMASMLWYIDDGQLLSLMQQAVFLAGHLKNDQLMSEHILNCLNRIRDGQKSQGKKEEEKEENAPLVGPDEVFNNN